MKKILLLFLLFCISCVVIINKKLDCNSLDIVINNKLYNNPLSIVNLKMAIVSKLTPLLNNNSTNVCTINLTINDYVYELGLSSVGSATRENVKTNTNFKFLKNNEIVFTDSINLFYGKNVNKQRYSNYKKEKKIENDINEQIASEIYKTIILNNK